MRGHVYVIRGDLTAVACRAWLLPTDEAQTVEAPWSAALAGRTDPRTWEPWGTHERVRRIATPSGGEPDIWIADIGTVAAEPDWYVDAVTAFVRGASAAYPPADNARLPLVAMPVVGTGEGGGAKSKGRVLEALFAGLYAVLGDDEVAIDVAMVCFDAKTYAAAQRARLRVLTDDRPDLTQRVLQSWPFADPDRSEDLGIAATRLADAARSGKLAVFMGAGVSMGAGLPGWSDLLAELAAGLERALDADQLRERLPDPRDQAALIERRLVVEKDKRLADMLPEVLQTSRRYSLQHGLLSSLPVTEFTTTNFDELFEIAACTDGRTLRVLPPGAREEHDGHRWLLKLHGTLSEPDSIVLTRSSYIEAPRERGALLGLVQAMLMTRHMLFVGYGLRDEDFHELVHEVRHALPAGSSAEHSSLGTALTLFHDELESEIWAGEVDVVPVLSDSDVSVAQAGREVELFLDLVGLLAADRCHFLLDPDYAEMLTVDEERLVDQLRRLDLTDLGTSDGWLELQAFMQRFGLDGHEPGA